MISNFKMDKEERKLNLRLQHRISTYSKKLNLEQKFEIWELMEHMLKESAI